MTLAELPGTFLSNRPSWTLTNAAFRTADGRTIKIEQSPFRFVDGLWQAEAAVTGLNGATTHVVLRIAPETLRRWAEAGINPFLEAAAQLEEHLRPAARQGHLSVLTLL
jgi:hypothetical protein